MQTIIENADWKLVKADDSTLHLQSTDGTSDIIITKQKLLGLNSIIDGAEKLV